MIVFPEIKNHELLSQKVYRIIKRDIIQGKLVSDIRKTDHVYSYKQSY